MVRLAAFLLFAAAPGRIVSTAPAVTEILFALGLGDKVVGVTQFCNYPPEARKKPRIGTFLQPNLEVILSLRPDLVVIQKNPVRLGARLESMGLKTMEVDQPTVEAVYDSIRRIGAAAGVPGRAGALEEKMRAEVAAIRDRAAGRPRRRVVFIVGRNPNAIEGLVAVGKGSYLNELLRDAGGENIFENTGAAYPRIAVEERRVYAVASDIFVVPGPRIVEAAREFARMLGPEAGW